MTSKSESGNFVKPLLPCPSRLYTLSTIDQYVPKRWLTRLMYFPTAGDATTEETYTMLRDGLRCVITMYPQLTGKVCRQPDKPHYAAVQTHDGAGVQFSFKDHTKPTLPDSNELQLPAYARLKELGFPMQGLVEIACPDAMLEEVAEGSCMFAAQANFVEGGLVVAIVLNHLLVDGGFFNELIRNWASSTAEVSQGHGVSVAPIAHAEHVVKQLSGGETSGETPDSRNWIVGDSQKSTLFMPAPGTPANSIVHPKKKSVTSNAKSMSGSGLRIWTISADKQKQLKEYAAGYSTMDSILAMLWNRNATHANLQSRGFDTAYARMPIDMRARLSPPVSANYIGNTVATIVTECPVSQVSGTDIQGSVASTAQSIRQSIKTFSQHDFEVFIGMANSLPADKAMVQPSPAIFDPSILLNDHSKMGIHVFDWGHGIGKVERLRDALDDVPVRHLSLCLCMPRLPDGTIEVVTLFDFEVNDALEKDETFLWFFQPYSDGSLWL